MAIAKLQQLDGIQVLQVALQTLHNTLYVFADAEVVNYSVILAQVCEWVNCERVPVERPKNTL